ncbi:type I-U CRISPR-associated protein Csb2 [Accumulibacter sp.]|uniref:type I-G CRISPR-associated protein Csb2 n=1 Tax=Accumulibacter sp. TaxID=2053492 RepID=UPI001AD12260|nr:type I-U CRISPR-associated protein Csb2 [Accumulibacter sp.]MBN8514520.1 type I-U CRISPR-associated protein Cas5/Cas6 [Accumulibacter sp.]MBO3702452.1 type I-U CRISPR-associated protein Cas5/Cas6 [Accumulibacter sp.]
MLALRIDFLNRLYHAADPTAYRAPEWPPHPDRVFQALVASAYGTAISPAPLRALEGQAPELAFGDARTGLTGSIYTAAAWLEKSKREPWNRTNVLKYDPVMVNIGDPVYLIWPAAPDDLRAPLAAIAAGVTYLGRAKTPVAVSVVSEIPNMPHRLTPSRTGEQLLRVPQLGRLDELDAAFDTGRRASVAGMVGYTDIVDRIAPSPWGELLPLRPKRLMDIRRTAQLADGLRAAVLGRAGDGAPLLLHGHGGDHAAWAIIPDVGHTHARGHVLGLGLWLPHGIDEQARTDCVLPLMEVDYVIFGDQQVDVGMPSAHQQTPRGLSRQTWSRPSRTWASVTPVVLDRHPKRGQRAEDVVADSVEMAGYPRPVDVELGQGSVFKGVPFAREFRPRSRGSWTHVALAFAQRVAGPLLVGRDRHFGMGLLRPVDDLRVRPRQETT